MANRLRDFTLSEPIFVDTNILVYQQVAHPIFGPDSRDFLANVESGAVQAATSGVVIHEALYIVQTQRAASLLGTPNRGIIHARMATDAALAAECSLAARHLLTLVDALQQGGLAVIDVQLPTYRDACVIGEQFRLFISDATHVAVCQQLGIAHIASNDTDLDRVPFLTRWEPRS